MSATALRALSAFLTGTTLLAGGAYVVCSSHNALPGDVSYSVKTGIGEPLSLLLAGNPVNRASISADYASNRLEEGEQLAANGEVTPSQGKNLGTSFQLAANDAQRDQSDAADTNPAGAAKAACDFQAKLDGHVQLLAGLRARAENTDTQAALAQLAAKAQAEANESLALCLALRVKAGADLKAQAQVSLKAAQEAIAHAHVVLDKEKAALGAKLTADANAQLDAADHILAGGQAKLTGNAYAEAGAFFEAAARTADDVVLRNNTLLNIHAQGGADGEAIINTIQKGQPVILNLNGALNTAAKVAAPNTQVQGGGAAAVGAQGTAQRSGNTAQANTNGNTVVNIDATVGGLLDGVEIPNTVKGVVFP